MAIIKESGPNGYGVWVSHPPQEDVDAEDAEYEKKWKAQDDEASTIAYNQEEDSDSSE